MKSLSEEIDEGVRAWQEAKPEARRMVREAAIASLAGRSVVGASEMFDDALAQARGPEVRSEHISDVLARELERMQAPQQGIATPFPLLNHLLVGGMQPGELVYLGARPGIGKSTLGLELARHAAKAGTRVLFVSREMLGTALVRRMIAQEGRISASKLRLGSAWVDMGEVNDTAARLSGLPIWITDTAATLNQIDALMDDIDLLIVDYLQLLEAPKAISERRLQVTHSSNGLKALAIRQQVPVLCLSSLRRPDAGNPEPTLASLKESGDTEHDADVVLFLHRPDPQVTDVVLIVAKNRDGETGRLKLAFKGEWVSFFAIDTRWAGSEARL